MYQHRWVLVIGAWLALFGSVQMCGDEDTDDGTPAAVGTTATSGPTHTPTIAPTPTVFAGGRDVRA